MEKTRKITAEVPIKIPGWDDGNSIRFHTPEDFKATNTVKSRKTGKW